MESTNKYFRFEGMEAGGCDLNKPIDLTGANLVIRVVNAILFRAVKDKVSEIFVEPSELNLVVRFRTAGGLHDIFSLPKELQSSITSRLKIMANLIISERTLPQDGRIPIKIGGEDTEVRLRTTPTDSGECLIICFQDPSILAI